MSITDWLSSKKSEIRFNPRIPQASKDRLLAALPLIDDLKESSICFATSGTSGNLKWVVLPKTAFINSAQAVNTHLHATSSDVWLNPLPDFHVGGAGITARGFISGAKVIPCTFAHFRWSATEFISSLCESKATLTAIVPTQLYDLVTLGTPPPSSLRAVIVGGGLPSEELYVAALKLGWKLLLSYGLTECASQVATAPYGAWETEGFPLAQPLSHVQLALDEKGYLKIKSPSLLSAYIEDIQGQFSLRDPKIDGWFTTEDVAQLEGSWLKSIRRGEDFVKIGGENVDLLRLESVLSDQKRCLNIQEDMALIALPDPRLGYAIHLALAAPEVRSEVTRCIHRYHERVFPFEKIHHVHCIHAIPRSPLNKVLKKELRALLKSYAC